MEVVREEREEKLYLLMPEYEKCPTCGCDIWEVSKVVYERKMGVGWCARCGHGSWFCFFVDGKLKGRVITKEDVEFLLFEPDL